MTKPLALLSRTRSRGRDERGFTLIELLVVILIIGILAAIALPTFLGHQQKAQDAQAMYSLRNALTAARSYAEEHNGYMGMTAPDLVDVDSGLAGARNLQVLGPWSKTQMALSVDSRSGTTFYIYDNSWSPNGAPVAANGIDRWCNNPGKGMCRTYGNWGAWGGSR